jgi:cytochrome P450
MQATLSTAAFPNTVPTLFWTIYEIYSRPDLLDEIRKEVSSKAVRKSEGGGFTLELAVLQTECPLLLSAYQETQRTRHSQVAFRMVLEDTLLDGRYLLKKGNVVHIPAKPTHKDTSIWGAQAAAFDPYRFVPAAGRAGGGGEKEKAKVVPSSFLAWGRPPYLCPARQFASTEILMIVALLVLRIDLAPVGGKGWEEPAVRSGMEIPTIPRPKEDMRLRITVRDEMAGSWKVIIGEGKTRISLASG